MKFQNFPCSLAQSQLALCSPCVSLLMIQNRPVREGKDDSDSVPFKSRSILATESFWSDCIYTNRIVQLFNKYCLCAQQIIKQKCLIQNAKCQSIGNIGVKYIYKENYKTSRYTENGNCDHEPCGVHGECLWHGSS